MEYIQITFIPIVLKINWKSFYRRSTERKYSKKCYLCLFFCKYMFICEVGNI